MLFSVAVFFFANYLKNDYFCKNIKIANYVEIP